MDRRTFLRNAALTSGAAVLGSSALSSCWWGQGAGGGLGAKPPGPGGRNMLEFAAASCPVQRVVLVMMENRSFDHWLGWLADDEAYLEAGRPGYGADFTVDGPAAADLSRSRRAGRHRAHARPARRGEPVGGAAATPIPGTAGTRAAPSATAASSPPAAATTSSPSATTRATTCRSPRSSPGGSRAFDRYHASVLGPTYPNREYLHSAQSGGTSPTPAPARRSGFQWDTIWDRLDAAGVSVRLLLLRPARPRPLGPAPPADRSSPIDDYFDRLRRRHPARACRSSTPASWRRSRTDNHPHGDIRAGEAFVRDVFRGVRAARRTGSNGMFVLTYDEWGGFFDHVPPPILPDDRASTVDAENFGQAGFRVPTVLASPYVQPGFVDHRLYDHTSILRFLEWRFLGAPPEGPGGSTATAGSSPPATATPTTSVPLCGSRTNATSTSGWTSTS